MNEDIVTLQQALRQNEWRAANKQTWLLFKETMPPLAQIRRIDTLWQEHSGGRFGFTPQYQVWTKLAGPPFKSGYELWEFFNRFGDEVGWRQGVFWACWPGVPPKGFPTLEVVSREACSLPKGCLPFHDVMSPCNEGEGFSPRDCWGEYIWDRWADLFSLIQETRPSR